MPGQDWIRTGVDGFDALAVGDYRAMVQLPFFANDGQEALDFPVVIIGRGNGPTALVTGGTHGDEFEGQAVAWHLARTLTPDDVPGRAIIVPTHNRPACLAGARVSPIDGLDINRIYPGDDTSGPSHAIARFVSRVLMPEADLYIDLHTGGRAMEFVLSSNLQGCPGTAQFERDLPGLLAMNAPYALVFDEDDSNAMPHQGTTEALFRNLGRPAFSSEFGGGRMTARSFQTALESAQNLLRHFGVMDGPAVDPGDSRSLLLFMRGGDQYIRMPCPGLLVPQVMVGDNVRSGDLLAMLFPQDPDIGMREIRARTNGLVVAIATACRGGDDPAFMIAEPLTP